MTRDKATTGNSLRLAVRFVRENRSACVLFSRAFSVKGTFSLQKRKKEKTAIFLLPQLPESKILRINTCRADEAGRISDRKHLVHESHETENELDES